MRGKKILRDLLALVIILIIGFLLHLALNRLIGQIRHTYLTTVLASVAIVGLALALFLSKSQSKKIYAQEEAYIASASEKARKLFHKKKEFTLHLPYHKKIYYILGFILLPAVILTYLFISYWYLSGLTLTILFTLFFLYLLLTIKVINFTKKPIIQINEKGIKHYSKGKVINWNTIAEISLLKPKVLIPVFPYIFLKKHRVYYLLLGLYSHKKGLFDFLDLNLPTDEFNASLVVEYANAYAKKAGSPLIELKRKLTSEQEYELKSDHKVDKKKFYEEIHSALDVQQYTEQKSRWSNKLKYFGIKL